MSKTETGSNALGSSFMGIVDKLPRPSYLPVKSVLNFQVGNNNYKKNLTNHTSKSWLHSSKMNINGHTSSLLDIRFFIYSIPVPVSYTHLRLYMFILFSKKQADFLVLYQQSILNLLLKR